MGVNGLKKLLREKSVRAFFSLSINKFRQTRIAIDANNLMYANMATAQKDIIRNTDILMEAPSSVAIRRRWIDGILNFTFRWLRYDITPVFVFDGPPNPLKMETCKNRREQRTKNKQEIDELQTKVQDDLLSVSNEEIDKLRTKMNNNVNITSEDMSDIIAILKSIGIPCIMAPDDAEKLCSMLCYQGLVSAVFSKDADCIGFNSPLIITEYSHETEKDALGIKHPKLECIRLDHLLDDVKFTINQMIDLIILLGCDYNTSTPNSRPIYGYGPKKCFNLIEKYQSIDDFPESIPIHKLKHIISREQFKHDEIPEDLKLDLSEIDISIVTMLFSSFNLTHRLHEYTNILKTFNPGNSQTVIDLTPIKEYTPEKSRFVQDITIIDGEKIVSKHIDFL